MPPEIEVCSKCKDSCGFERDVDGRYRSVCCWALPVKVDIEPDDLL